MPSIEITHPAPDGEGTSFVVNGVEMKYDISKNAQIELDGARPPRVTVDLHLVQDFRLCSKDAELVLSQATRDLLVEAGWTPPGEGAACGHPGCDKPALEASLSYRAVAVDSDEVARQAARQMGWALR